MGRCQSGQESCVGEEELCSLLQLKDKRRVVDIFGLYSKVQPNGLMPPVLLSSDSLRDVKSGSL